MGRSDFWLGRSDRRRNDHGAKWPDTVRLQCLNYPTFQRSHFLLGFFRKHFKPFEHIVVAFNYDVFIYRKRLDFCRRNCHSKAKFQNTAAFRRCYRSQFMHVRGFPSLHNWFSHDFQMLVCLIVFCSCVPPRRLAVFPCAEDFNFCHDTVRFYNRHSICFLANLRLRKSALKEPAKEFKAFSTLELFSFAHDGQRDQESEESGVESEFKQNWQWIFSRFPQWNSVKFGRLVVNILL